MAPLSRSTSDQMVDTAAIPTPASSAYAPATGDSPMPNPGPDSDNELTDAKIAAAEARTDTKLRDVDVKFERVLGEVRLGFQELRTNNASFKTDIVAFKAEARSNMQWIIGVVIGTGLTLGALTLGDRANILSAFQAAFAVASAKQASQAELPLAQPPKAPASVPVPAP